MTKKIMIGRRQSKKRLFIYYSISILLAFIVLCGSAAVSFHYLQTLHRLFFLMIGALFLTGLFLIIFLPLAGTNQYIEVSAEQVAYYHTENPTLQFKETLHLIRNEPGIPDIQFQTSSIEKVVLSYRQDKIMGLVCYIFVMKFYLNDGVVITLSPDALKSEDGIYLKALSLFENQGIKIDDPYHLKNGLVKDSTYFQNYIQSLKKENANHA